MSNHLICFLRDYMVFKIFAKIREPFISCSPLRPYPISKPRLVPEGIERPDWAFDVSHLKSLIFYLDI